MRTPLIVLALGGAFALVACGDASGNSSNNYRTAQTNGTDQGDTSDTDPTAGKNDETPPATPPDTPPAPPMSMGTPAQDGTFTATVDNAAVNADLGNTAALKVTITPAMGFTGEVDLDVTGLPATVTAKWDTQKVTIMGTTPGTANLTLDAAVSSVADTVPLVVTAHSAAKSSISATANVNFKINPQILMTIPLNFSAMQAATANGIAPMWGAAFGDTQTKLAAPKDGSNIVVNVLNSDSAPHEIHGNNTGGTIGAVTSTASFPHGVGNIATGAMDTKVPRVVKAGQSYTGYLHDIGSGKNTGFAVSVGN